MPVGREFRSKHCVGPNISKMAGDRDSEMSDRWRIEWSSECNDWCRFETLPRIKTVPVFNAIAVLFDTKPECNQNNECSYYACCSQRVC